MPFNTPNVYTQEQSGLLPPSISNADTIPAFIGYTENGPLNTPTRITSLLEYETTFGSARNEEGLQVTVQDTEDSQTVTMRCYSTLLYDSLYHPVQMFFANGGGACYIVSVAIQTVSETKIIGDDTNGGDAFGSALAISGDTIAVRSDLSEGVIYVFRRQTDGTWLQEDKFTSGSPSGGIGANSLAFSGDTIVEGQFVGDGLVNNSGAAFVYERQSNNAWLLTAKLEADDGATNDYFGRSCAISSDSNRIIVGASQENGDRGAAYIYERQTNSSWLQISKISADDGAPGDDFGNWCALSGDTAMVAARRVSNGGAAYFFERQSDGNWLQLQKLIADDRESGDEFGQNLSLVGDRAVIGAYSEDNEFGNSAGSVYEFQRQSNGTWLQINKLVADDLTAGDLFGASVSLCGDLLLVGAYGDDDGGNLAGAAYVYKRQSDNSWLKLLRFKAADARALAFVGWQVSLYGNTALIGAFRDGEAGSSAGAAYILDLEGPTLDTYQAGLDTVADEEEVNLLVFPNAANDLCGDAYYELCQIALSQAATLKDRFVIMDTADDFSDAGERFRDGIGDSNLDYGAVYYPHIQTTLPVAYADDTVTISHMQSDGVTASTYDGYSLATLQGTNDLLYNQIILKLDSLGVTMPASGAMAGVYAHMDHDKGVWKAPANTALANVSGPTVKLSDAEQATFNVDETTGKSINVIRSFDGRGTLVWGGRTLDGNDHDWRYISTKRLLIQIERDLQTLTAAAIGNVNLSRNWTKFKGLIESYLMDLWQRGGLVGSSAEEAYFIGLGAGETMTTQDIINGDLNITVGVAATRPAEFVIITFTQQ